MITQKKYHAKILLFGEHVVLKGADALAIPFQKFGGKWMFAKRLESASLQQMQLPQFLDYLKDKTETLDYFSFDYQTFNKALEQGVFFQSNIPLGYGAGSSGALCAAIYDAFGLEKSNDLQTLKKIFSMMESFFHGSSSGFDPLVSYLNQPIRISKGEMQLLGNKPKKSGLFLVDTGMERSASEYINIFMSKCEDKDYEQSIKQELVPLTTQAIDSYLNEDSTTLFHQMHDISRFQYLHFNEMIPDHIVSYWEKSLRSDHFKLKVCGAGGGGFLLGMTKDFEKTKALFNPLEIIKI